MTSNKITTLPHHEAVEFSVIKQHHSNPFPGQRSHKLHLDEASYLKTRRPLSGDQLVFHAVRYCTVGKNNRKVWVTHLIDGYTRIEAVLLELMQAPEEVLLLTHVVENYDAAYALYCQFNSPKAAKRGKHQVQSGVREASTKSGGIPRDSFESALMVTGPLTSGIQYSGVKGTDIRAKVSHAYRSLCELDEMGMRKHFETTGLMAAYIAIMERDRLVQGELASQFIKMVNYDGNFESKKAADAAIIETRRFHNKRREMKTTSGTRNVYEIRDFVLTQYQNFLAMKLRKPSLTPRGPLTLGQFKTAA